MSLDRKLLYYFPAGGVKLFVMHHPNVGARGFIALLRRKSPPIESATHEPQ